MDQPGGRQAGIMQPVCQTALHPLRLHASAPSPRLPMTHGVKRTSRGSVSPSSCRKLRIGCNSADFMTLFWHAQAFGSFHAVTIFVSDVIAFRRP